jgi:ubiquinol-cytochrome c reductase subunit 7
MEEERESVQIALKRLSSKESYDRIYRIRRAVQCSYQHKLLPKSEWTKPEEVRYSPTPISKDPPHLGTTKFELLTIRFVPQDVSYLQHIIEQVEAEIAEKDALDTASVIKKH